MVEVIGHWSLVIGHWSLVIGHWSLVIGHWSLVIGHWYDFDAEWHCLVVLLLGLYDDLFFRTDGFWAAFDDFYAEGF